MIDDAGYLMSAGHDVALARAEGVNDNMRSSHFHTYYEVYYLEKGERFHVAEDHLYGIGPGELIIFPPYVMHHSYSDPDVHFSRLVLYFYPDVITSPELRDRIDHTVRSYRFTGQQRRVIEDIFRDMMVAQSTHEEFAVEELKLLTNELIIKTIRNRPTDSLVERHQRITQVIRYLHDHHHQPLKLDDIAAHFFISPYHLCREFKKCTQSTLMNYLTNVRIGHAQRLLNETELTITQVSKAVGFTNVTHFNRVFKAMTGMSPGRYRRLTPAGRTSVTPSRPGELVALR